jgi:signal recognition particle subunit SRP54
MFETLSEKITAAIKLLSNKSRISEKDIQVALTEIRRALLEADVNFKVVKKIQSDITEKILGQDLIKTVSPGQQIVKIFHDELTKLLGDESKSLKKGNQKPSSILVVGLQGSGKTTTVAKIGKYLKDQGDKVLLAAGDLKRPGAIEQITTLGDQVGVSTHSELNETDPIKLAKTALKKAEVENFDWLIFDTAGRIQIDDDLMSELTSIYKALMPTEIILVVDAMTGQESVDVAQQFMLSVPLSGIILTKMDGDARGGAALSIVSMTNLPIFFIGVGEKIENLDVFHPDRLAGRILGMGDVVSLVEKAQQSIDENQIADMEKKLRSSTFTLDDFLIQIEQLRKMGPMSQVLEMIPGMNSISKNMPTGDMAEKDLKHVEAIVLSMTPKERNKPEIIGGSRRKRIARGSGTQPADVNRLLNQFSQMKKMMKQLGKGGKLPGMPF